MRRRDFIKVIAGSTAAWPIGARAQQSDRMRRVGILMGLANDAEGQARFTAFQTGLHSMGWTEGRNITLDVRWGSADVSRIKGFAAELVSLGPDAILATNTPTVRALQQATKTIPIVFVSVSDPVGDGFVASLAKPGGNITGFSNYDPAMAGKWLQLLKEIAPGTVRITVIFNPDTAPHSIFLPSMEAAALTVAVMLNRATVRDTVAMENVIATLGREPGAGLVVMPDSFMTVHRALIIRLAARHRLPTVYTFPYFARDGGLMSYGVDLVGQFRRAPSYVDRILKGTKPADLPVQQPTKFEFVINLKTAKALGLTIPPTLLVRADQVIE